MPVVAVAKVSAPEAAQIKALHTRKLALRELVCAMARLRPAELEEIYERVVKDLADTCWRCDRWWVDATKQYGLTGHCHIDFDTGEILQAD